MLKGLIEIIKKMSFELIKQDGFFPFIILFDSEKKQPLMILPFYAEELEKVEGEFDSLVLVLQGNVDEVIPGIGYSSHPAIVIILESPLPSIKYRMHIIEYQLDDGDLVVVKETHREKESSIINKILNPDQTSFKERLN